MADSNKQILAAYDLFIAAMTKAGYKTDGLSIGSYDRDPLYPRAPRTYGIVGLTSYPHRASDLIAMLTFATALLSLPREVKLDVLHSRDPDSECSHEYWINGEPVQAHGYEDIDPGRGYQRDDWNERIKSWQGDESPFGLAVQAALQASADSQYIAGEDDSEGLDLAEGVSLDEPDLTKLTEREVPEGSVRMILKIENSYALYDDVTTYADIVVPVPPAQDEEAGVKDLEMCEETPYETWSRERIYSLTGVGHTNGDSFHDVTVLWSSDSALVGRTFDWGY